MADDPALATIDPNGDTWIILEKPKTKLQELFEEFDSTQHEEAPEDGFSNSENSSISDQAGEATLDRAANESDNVPKEASTTKFLVSSRQLCIVSPYFDNMLKGSYGESIPNPEDGLYHIQAEGWCPEAMEVVLNIAHVRVKRTPESVSLELFVKILMIVDYYQMQDTIAFHAKFWLVHIKEMDRPIVYCPEAVYWLFLAFQLNESEIFKEMADIIVLTAFEGIHTLDLPFGSAVQDELNNLRNAAIRKLYSGIQLLRRSLDAKEVGCSHACSAMLLRTLHYGLLDEGLESLTQPPEWCAFQSMSFEDFWASLRKIRDPKWYESVSCKKPHSCGLRNQFDSICFLSGLQTKVVLSKFGL